MPIKNYTTKVSANQSIREIQDSLVAHGATQVLLEYEKGTGKIQALNFMLSVNENSVPFRLPIDWQKFQTVLKEQNVNRHDDEDYCYRVAWRNIRDWVLAQMALYETQMVEIEQVFLPYAIGKNDKTLYETVLEGKFLLGDGN